MKGINRNCKELPLLPFYTLTFDISIYFRKLLLLCSLEKQCLIVRMPVFSLKVSKF
jgi:hypothetical protein